MVGTISVPKNSNYKHSLIIDHVTQSRRALTLLISSHSGSLEAPDTEG